jgi:hypothetical protein
MRYVINIKKDNNLKLFPSLILWHNMTMHSKDLCLIICMAALGLVTTLLIVQTARMITGIPGANYIFTVILAIQTSFSLLMYEGRRWRFFFQMTLFTILIIPTNLGGAPFNILPKMNTIITAFFCDLLFNTLYLKFKRRDKLLWWTIIATIIFWVMNPFVSSFIKPLFYPPEYVTKFIEVVLLMLPVILTESIVGGYIGHKIYKRVKNISN